MDFSSLLHEDFRHAIGELSDEAIAHVAQLAEHVLGKDEVISSILIMGSRFENENEVTG